jgi:hypothetical protein
LGGTKFRADPAFVGNLSLTLSSTELSTGYVFLELSLKIWNPAQNCNLNRCDELSCLFFLIIAIEQKSVDAEGIVDNP